MSLTFVYSDRPESFTVDLGTQAVRLGRWSVTESAELGTVGSSDISIDDPDGDAGHSGDQILGYHILTITEDSAPSGNQIIGTPFYIHDRTYEIAESLKTGAAVRITMQLTDLTDSARFRVIREAAGNRPAESVGDRITYALNAGYVNLTDNGLVVYPATVMDANDYRNQTTADLLDDCAKAVGFWWSLYWDETASSGSEKSLMFFDPNASTLYTSSSRLTNIIEDRDSYPVPESGNSAGAGATQTWLLDEIKLTRSDKDLASHQVLPWSGGTVDATRAATAAIYGSVDAIAPDSNVRSAAKALARANHAVWESRNEEDILTGTLRLPPANVNDIRKGQRVLIKTRNLPGYMSDYTYCRVLERSVGQEALTQEFYTVRLKLSPQEAAQPTAAIVQSAFGGAGSEVGQDVRFRMPSDVTVGNTLVYISGISNTGDPQPAYHGISLPSLGGTGAWTHLGSFYETTRTLSGAGYRLGAWAKVADGTEPQSENLSVGHPFAGCWEFAGDLMAGLTVIGAGDGGAPSNDLDAGSAGSPSSSETVVMGAAQFLGSNPGYMAWIPTSQFSTDLQHNKCYYSDPRPWWLGHATGDGTAMEAEIGSSLVWPWAAIAVKVTP